MRHGLGIVPCERSARWGRASVGDRRWVRLAAAEDGLGSKALGAAICSASGESRGDPGERRLNLPCGLAGRRAAAMSVSGGGDAAQTDNLERKDQGQTARPELGPKLESDRFKAQLHGKVDCAGPGRDGQ